MPAVEIVTPSLKVPLRQPVSPAARCETRYCAVRNGAARLPAFASLPVDEAYFVQTTSAEAG